MALRANRVSTAGRHSASKSALALHR
jgi:hypothetical protein